MDSKKKKCKGKTRANTRCKCLAADGSDFCSRHQDQAPTVDEVAELKIQLKELQEALASQEHHLNNELQRLTLVNGELKDELDMALADKAIAKSEARNLRKRIAPLEVLKRISEKSKEEMEKVVEGPVLSPAQQLQMVADQAAAIRADELDKDSAVIATRLVTALGSTVLLGFVLRVLFRR